MWDSNQVVQEIELSRDEFLGLKYHLAEMRGYDLESHQRSLIDEFAGIVQHMPAGKVRPRPKLRHTRHEGEGKEKRSNRMPMPASKRKPLPAPVPHLVLPENFRLTDNERAVCARLVRVLREGDYWIAPFASNGCYRWTPPR